MPSLGYNFVRSGRILSVDWYESGDYYSCRTEPHKLKQRSALGEVLAKYYDNAWKLSICEEDAEEALRQYIEEEERRLSQVDKKSPFDEEDAEEALYRLESIKQKLKAHDATLRSEDG